MDVELQVVFDGETVIAYLSKLATELPTAILDQLGLVSEKVVEVMREKVSVGATGNLKRSIGFTIVPEALTSVIKPAEPYADFVELGTRPHVPPIDALTPWADMHGINPWALQRSIAKKGTMAHPYIIPTYVEMGPEVAPLFAEGLAAFIEEAHA